MAKLSKKCKCKTREGFCCSKANGSKGVRRLTSGQKAEVRSELIQAGTPVRFLVGGRALNIETGDFDPKGTNIMHQTVYWRFSKATAKKIARWLDAKAVFSG